MRFWIKKQQEFFTGLAFVFSVFLNIGLRIEKGWTQEKITQENILSIKQKQKQADEKRKNLEKERKQTLNQLRSLQKKLALNASEAQKLEHKITLAENEINALQRNKTKAEYQLRKDHDSLRNLLAALQKIEQSKPPALLVSPDDVIKAARAAGLIAEITPLIESRANRLKQKLKTYALLRKELINKQEVFKKSEQALAIKYTSIKNMIVTKQIYQKQLLIDTKREAKRVSELASQAKTLSELLAKLQAFGAGVIPRLKPEKSHSKIGSNASMNLVSSHKLKQVKKLGRAFIRAKGRLLDPTTGFITKWYGQDGHKGVTYKTRKNAQIIAPYDGYIEFAGLFGNYGQTLILNVGSGYHILLTGLESLTGYAGQTVIKGEPVGKMSGTDKIPELYFEIRRQGVPVNPTLWLRKRKTE